MSSALPDPTGVDIPSNRTYLNYRQVEDYKEDIASLEQNLADPAARIEDRGEVRKQVQRIKRDLDTQSPPEVTREQMDSLVKEEQKLLAEILEGMPSQQEMRRRPAGAVNKQIKWEKANKTKILRRMNIMRIIHREDEDTDVANLERHRSDTNTLNMENCLIAPKEYFMPPTTEAYKQGYDRTFLPEDQKPADANVIREMQAQINVLLERLEAAPAAPTSVEKSRKPLEPGVSRCGRTFKSKAGAMGHDRSCKHGQNPETPEE